MTLPILHQLKAEVLLADTDILEKVSKLRNSFTYKTSSTVYSFDDYYAALLKQTENIEKIELLTVVPPGTAQKYLVDLTQALQEVTDKIDTVHGRALFFAGKVRAAMHNRNSLLAAFTVWYQVALADVLLEKKLKFTASVQAALAESEFTRLLGDDVILEGVEDAVDMLIEQLKGLKKLATEKYKIGTDQANTSIIRTPNVGMMEGESFPLLRQRFGLQDENPPKPKYDDEEDDGLAPEAEDPQFVEKREIRGQQFTDQTIKIIEASVEEPEVAVVEAEDMAAATLEWRAKQTQAEPVDDELPADHKSRRELAVEIDEVLKAKDQAYRHPTTGAITEASHEAFKTTKVDKPKVRYADDEDEPAPTASIIVEDPFLGTVKLDTKADGTATVTKEKGGKFEDFDEAEFATPKNKTKAKYADDEDEETLAPVESKTGPVTPKPVKKDRKKIDFDSPF